MAVDKSTARRRANFTAYYKANPDKLGGKTIDEAYDAMRRESGRQVSADNRNGVIQAARKRVSKSETKVNLFKASAENRFKRSSVPNDDEKEYEHSNNHPGPVKYDKSSDKAKRFADIIHSAASKKIGHSATVASKLGIQKAAKNRTKDMRKVGY